MDSAKADMDVAGVIGWVGMLGVDAWRAIARQLLAMAGEISERDSLVWIRGGVIISVLARASDGVVNAPSDSEKKGGTFSLLESPSWRHKETRARFVFGVSSGVGMHAWSMVDGLASGWWDRLPSTELWDLVCMLCSEGRVQERRRGRGSLSTRSLNATR